MDRGQADAPQQHAPRRHSSTAAMTVPHVIPASLLLPKVARAGPVAVTFLHTPAAHSWSLGQTLPHAPHCTTWRRVKMFCCTRWDLLEPRSSCSALHSKVVSAAAASSSVHHPHHPITTAPRPHIVRVTLHVGALLVAQAVCMASSGHSWCGSSGARCQPHKRNEQPGVQSGHTGQQTTAVHSRPGLTGSGALGVACSQQVPCTW